MPAEKVTGKNIHPLADAERPKKGKATRNIPGFSVLTYPPTGMSIL